ncbi:MAG TPA: glycosyltransferase family 1 protein [Vicinamibacterales bacterium]|nr:glycosyltransferase family 1 protein [Vicinamibacterales bacterium]
MALSLLCYDPARVDILIDYRPALRQRTGVGQYVHGLATSLAARLEAPDSLTLFSSSWKDRLPASVVPDAKQIDARVPVRVLNLAWHRLEWPPIEWLTDHHADVVHSLHPLLIPSRSAARVVTVPDLYFLDRPEHTAAEIRRDYSSLAESHVRRADGVVVISRYTGRQVAQRFEISPDRITVCYPGKPSWSRRPDPAVRGPVLFLGTVEPRKNVARLIEAYAAVLDRRHDTPNLVIAGRLDIPRDELLSRAPAGASHSARVSFAGYVDEAERKRLLSTASMLVLPSLDEGFGIPALEAMTIGLPVIASNRGALPEVVGDAGILIDPEDVRAWAAAIERLLSDDYLRRSLSAKGIEQAERFSWDSSADALYGAYRAAAARRQRSAT